MLFSLPRREKNKSGGLKIALYASSEILGYSAPARELPKDLAD
jgi:hypothetical protein